MAGLDEVPCVELEIKDQEALEIALIENLQRKDLTPFEEAEGFTTLIDTYSYTHEEVAAAVGRSRVTVTETLKLLVIPPEVRNACRHADITAKGMLLEIARAGDAESMLALVQQIVEERLDRAELRRRRQENQEQESRGEPLEARRRGRSSYGSNRLMRDHLGFPCRSAPSRNRNPGMSSRRCAA